ncbi:MAG: hypothetical protein QW215_02925 [Ignisphaera sp.]
MIKITRGTLAVGVATTMIIVAMVATIVYAQQGLGSVAEPLRRQWSCTLNNVTKNTVVQQYRHLWRFGWFSNTAKLQHHVIVSDEYKAKIIEILKTDPDVKKLLENGYNITVIKPLIKMYVQGDGSVVLKATQASVTLCKKGEGITVVLVDIEEGKVLKILQYKVIEKS